MIGAKMIKRILARRDVGPGWDHQEVRVGNGEVCVNDISCEELCFASWVMKRSLYTPEWNMTRGPKKWLWKPRSDVSILFQMG